MFITFLKTSGKNHEKLKYWYATKTPLNPSGKNKEKMVYTKQPWKGKIHKPYMGKIWGGIICLWYLFKKPYGTKKWNNMPWMSPSKILVRKIVDMAYILVFILSR